LGAALEAIVGAAHVEHPRGASLDGVPICAVVRPGTPEEVAACLGAAADASLALVPCGGRTKLAWGNPCAAQELSLLDLSRLDQRCDVQAQEGIARVGAGVRVGDLAAQLLALGKRTCLPAVYEGATVGGSVAADPLDPGRPLDPALRQDLLGLEVALANGELTRCGGSVVKNVTGFDLVRLYCGSYGTLGVITEVILRLRPVAEESRVLLRGCGSLEEALRSVAQLVSRGAAPDAALLVPENGRLRLLWRLEGSRADVAERAHRFAGDAADESDWSEAAARWTRPPAPDRASLRVGARSSDLPALATALHAWCGADGVLSMSPLRGVIRAQGDPGGVPPLIAQAQREAWMLFVDAAPAEAKRHFDVYGPAPSALPVLRALKERFDPRRVLAPGRFVARL
jgi:glycolate oxidase FAD binding subunit